MAAAVLYNKDQSYCNKNKMKNVEPIFTGIVFAENLYIFKVLS